MTATADHARLARNRLIKAIKAAERSLGIDEDAHRQMLRELVARESLTQCSMPGLRQVLDHLNKHTGRFKRREADGSQRALDPSPEARKLRALWLLLHRLGAVRNASESALAAYAKRTAGVDDLHWAHARLPALIEGLKAWAARELPAAIAARVAALQAVGVLDARNTVAGLIEFAAPGLRADTFDALHRAWAHLDELEGGHVTDPR